MVLSCLERRLSMAYPSDLTNKEWELIKDFFISGNRAKHDKRKLIDAVLYLTKTGCQWRQLPKDFPPHSTVHSFYRRMRIKGIWEKMMDFLVKENRKKKRERGGTYVWDN